MSKCIQALAFLQHVFDQAAVAQKAALIIEGILAAQSPRLTEIARHIPGSASASYKALQRFLKQVDVKAVLRRLLSADAPFVIGDPTEMARPQAYRTPYVGKLKDGKTRGFWLLLLATPYRGRALPCGAAPPTSPAGPPFPADPHPSRHRLRPSPVTTPCPNLGPKLSQEVLTVARHVLYSEALP